MKDTYVYVLGSIYNSEWFFKIGVSANPQKRILELQTGCPFNLSIQFISLPLTRQEAFNCESELHNKYQYISTYGEWFKCSAHHMEKIIDDITRLVTPQDIYDSIHQGYCNIFRADAILEIERGSLNILTLDNWVNTYDKVPLPRSQKLRIVYSLGLKHPKKKRKKRMSSYELNQEINQLHNRMNRD